MKRAYQFSGTPLNSTIARLSVFAISLLLSTTAFCQSAITLTAGNTPLKAGAFVEDSIKLAGLTAPTIGANQTWDYSSAQVAASTQEQLFQSTDPAFTSAAIFDTTGFDPLVDMTGIVFGGTYLDVYDQGSGTITEPGVSFSAQAFNVGALSKNPTDSLWIPAQNDLYSTPIIYLSFPATMGSTWSTTNVKRTLDMRVKVALLAGDSDFQRVTYFSMTDTVAGWGTLTLPSMAATPVLMVKVNKSRIDSFYLNGTVVGPLILGAFDLPSQGTVTSDYSYQFFAQGSLLPVLKVEYADPAYTQPASAVTYQSASASVAEMAPSGDIQVYPNPAQSRSFFIQSDYSLSPGDQVEVYDVSGKRIVLEPLSSGVSNGIIPISLPSETATGTYMVRILGANNQLLQQTKLAILP